MARRRTLLPAAYIAPRGWQGHAKIKQPILNAVEVLNVLRAVPGRRIACYRNRSRRPWVQAAGPCDEPLGVLSWSTLDKLLAHGAIAPTRTLNWTQEFSEL